MEVFEGLMIAYYIGMAFGVLVGFFLGRSYTKKKRERVTEVET